MEDDVDFGEKVVESDTTQSKSVLDALEEEEEVEANKKATLSYSPSTPKEDEDDEDAKFSEDETGNFSPSRSAAAADDDDPLPAAAGSPAAASTEPVPPPPTYRTSGIVMFPVDAKHRVIRKDIGYIATDEGNERVYFEQPHNDPSKHTTVFKHLDEVSLLRAVAQEHEPPIPAPFRYKAVNVKLLKRRDFPGSANRR